MYKKLKFNNIFLKKYMLYILIIMNVYIGGDKEAAFTSKTAIKKFKNELKKNLTKLTKFPTIDLMVLQKKYIHYDYKLELINKTDKNIIIKILRNDTMYNFAMDMYIKYIIEQEEEEP
jgi:hypothetical protein